MMKVHVLKTRTNLYCIVDTMAVDGLATKADRSSTAMVQSQLSCGILVSAPEELTHWPLGDTAVISNKWFWNSYQG